MPDFDFLMTVNTDTTPPTVTVRPAPEPPSTDAGPSPTYRTSGRWLLDPLGVKVIGRGVEQAYWRAPWLATSYVDEIARTGANQVRVLPYLTGRTPTGDPNATLADVEDMIQRAIRGHMLCDLAIDGGQVLDTWLRPDVLALLGRYEQHLVVHALGESYAETNTAWRESAIATVRRLRDAGLRMPLTVMSRQGGRNLPCLLEQGLAVVDADPLHNVICGWQAYWGSAKGYQREYGMELHEAMQYAAGAEVPIQVGLVYRSDPATSPQKVPFPDLMRWAQELQLSYWWWDWRMGIDNLSRTGKFGDWASATEGPGADGYPLGVTVSTDIAHTSVRTPYQLTQAVPS